MRPFSLSRSLSHTLPISFLIYLFVYLIYYRYKHSIQRCSLALAAIKIVSFSALIFSTHFPAKSCQLYRFQNEQKIADKFGKCRQLEKLMAQAYCEPQATDSTIG